MEGRNGLAVGLAAVFAAAALAFATMQVAGEVHPMPRSYSTAIPMPSIGTRLEVPRHARFALALPSCDSCPLRTFAPELVSRAARRRDFVLLAPNEAPSCSGSVATVLIGSQAMSRGPWVSLGPVLVSLDEQGTVLSVESEPKEVAHLLGGME